MQKSLIAAELIIIIERGNHGRWKEEQLFSSSLRSSTTGYRSKPTSVYYLSLLGNRQVTHIKRERCETKSRLTFLKSAGIFTVAGTNAARVRNCWVPVRRHETRQVTNRVLSVIFIIYNIAVARSPVLDSNLFVPKVLCFLEVEFQGDT